MTSHINYDICGMSVLVSFQRCHVYYSLKDLR